MDIYSCVYTQLLIRYKNKIKCYKNKCHCAVGWNIRIMMMQAEKKTNWREGKWDKIDIKF